MSKLLQEDSYVLLKEDGGALLLEIPYIVRSFKNISDFTGRDVKEFIERDMKDFTGRDMK